VDLPIVATTFAVVFAAELPDKTMVASLVLGTRFRALPAWLGIAGAFVVQCGIAVLAGGLFALLPHRLVQIVAGALFLVGAVILLRAAPEEEEQDVDDVAARTPPRTSRIVATSFLVIFVAEWGDLTQILTGTLAARYNDPLSVFVGALLALWAVAAIAITAGRWLLRVIPLRLVQRLAGLLFAGLAVLSAAEAILG
jgi:putative Ca2+/H+ antiporter (TMEM165/GDT1 family)